jgi:hypothetical protein
MLRSLTSNDRCLQCHYLATRLHATILSREKLNVFLKCNIIQNALTPISLTVGLLPGMKFAWSLIDVPDAWELKFWKVNGLWWYDVKNKCNEGSPTSSVFMCTQTEILTPWFCNCISPSCNGIVDSCLQIHWYSSTLSSITTDFLILCPVGLHS